MAQGNSSKDLINFRIAKYNEISLLETILREAYQPIAKILSRPPGALVETKRKLLNNLEENSLFCIIKDNKKVIGTFSLKKIDENTMRLSHFAIHPFFQHRGFGRNILNQIKREIKDKHSEIKILVLEVYKKTPELQMFYEEEKFLVFDDKTINNEKILILHHSIQ